MSAVVASSCGQCLASNNVKTVSAMLYNGPIRMPSKHAAFMSPTKVRKMSLRPHRRSVNLSLRAISSQDALEETSERSSMVNREAVLFLFQLEMDAQLQRALTYENFDVAKEIRSRREQIDTALRELQEHKGYGCGARHASRSAQIDFAPAALSLRSRLADAIAQERYTEAATLRDELAAVEERAAEAELPCPTSAPYFSLGQLAIHNVKGYQMVICGWDLACCESAEWQDANGVSNLVNGADQVFYHVLVDVSDWQSSSYDEPPVAYVPEELLAAASLADFGKAEPLAEPSFEHPYSYLMFLGSDGHGNMIPCRQLRDKYCIQRRDVHPPGASEDDDEEEDGKEWVERDAATEDVIIDSSSSNNNNSATSSMDDSKKEDSGDGIWGGGRRIPGIDMSSLDD